MKTFISYAVITVLTVSVAACTVEARNFVDDSDSGVENDSGVALDLSDAKNSGTEDAGVKKNW